MASEVKLPALGENIPGGDVLEVKVTVGQTVAEGQPLVELEAEKGTVEMPSPFAGRIANILVKKGDKVQTGQTLMLIDGADGKAAPISKEESKPPTPLAKTETKTPQTKTEAEAPAAVPKPPSPPTPVSGPVGEGAIVPAGPATRKLAREWGINLGQVPASGPLGRVTQDDIKGFVRSLAAGGGPGLPVPPLPDFEQWGPVEYKPFESIRKKTAEHVSLAWALVPHVTQHDTADVSEIENFRKQQEGKGPKLTVTAFVLKACAISLRQFPQFNSSLDVAQNRLVMKNYYHLGVAVDTERGLVVPVLRDVDKKSVQDIGREMTEIAERARQKKLAVADMQGGTFTISNLGGIGGTAFTPIVNYPQVAILGMSRSRMQPVYRDGQFVPRLILPLSLSYDHRVIDGADAARFTRHVAEMLENPLVMLLHA